MRIRLACALLACACFCIAAATPALATEFVSKASVETIVGKGTNPEFKLGKNTVKCGELKHEDSSQKLPTEQLKEKIEYEGCTFVEGTTVICLERNFHSNGTMTFAKCKIEGNRGKCKIIVGNNSAAGKVLYANSGNDLKVETDIPTLEYETIGCPSGAEKGKTGEYKDSFIDEGLLGNSININ